jgi:hypothetical protein
MHHQCKHSLTIGLLDLPECGPTERVLWVRQRSGRSTATTAASLSAPAIRVGSLFAHGLFNQDVISDCCCFLIACGVGGVHRVRSGCAPPVTVASVLHWAYTLFFLRVFSLLRFKDTRRAVN